MSDLSDFCKTVLEILELNKDDRPTWFCDYTGLCSNAILYDDKQGSHSQTRMRLAAALNYETYPFNSDEEDYKAEADTGTLYTNKKRLAFLREHASI